MRTRKLGGKEVSVLALGSTDFGGIVSAAQAEDFLDAFIAIGGNYIDTARVYGDFATPKFGESEKVIGRWMTKRGNRDSLFLSTKGGHPRFETMNVGRLSREEVRDDMARSLEDLETGCVDIYWLHRDDVTRPVGDIMETMQSLIDDGSTKMIGVSNWKPARILEANAYAREHGLTPFSGNQPQFSLARQILMDDLTLVQMDSEMQKMHLETGMLCTPFSSQAKGFFIKLDKLGESGLSDKARRRFMDAENLAVYNRLCTVREQTGLSVGALSLAWLMSQPYPLIPLVGVSSVKQVEELKEAGNAVITDEQRDFLRTL